MPPLEPAIKDPLCFYLSMWIFIEKGFCDRWELSQFFLATVGCLPAAILINGPPKSAGLKCICFPDLCEKDYGYEGNP
jgi:hypothetical protein